MKKVLSVLLIALVVSLSSCGSEPSNESTNDTTIVSYDTTNVVSLDTVKEAK
jgi:hypothetical protein